IIRLSRKSDRLPCQLRLDGLEPTPVVEQGGSATIFTASYNHQAVAIKRSHLPSIAHKVSSLPSDFVSEAVIWSHLKHENIVPFMGVIDKDYRLWLVSECMYSGNVNTGRENCDLRHLVRYIIRAAKGLCYLHTFDPPIVHGDLKGCNIMVDRRGNACLTDFGISGSDDTRQGLDSTNVGRRETPNWIAPELIFFGNSETMRMEVGMYMHLLQVVCYIRQVVLSCSSHQTHYSLPSPHFRSIPEASHITERI
ncbi:kinase-like domain-containing protein, partial [Suillus plorans]